MTLGRRRRTLRVMGIKSVVMLPQRWLDAAGIALVAALTVVGAYVEANPAHRYGGLHLTSHPPLAAYLLLAVLPVAHGATAVRSRCSGSRWQGRSVGRRSARSTVPRSFR